MIDIYYREDMVHSSKKLPCGHIFHTACLRSWFQRQQTCPTCRLNILRTTSRPATANVQNDPNVNPPNPVLPEANPVQGIPNNMPQGNFKEISKKNFKFFKFFVLLCSWSKSICESGSTTRSNVPSNSTVYASVSDVATFYDTATDATEFRYFNRR